MSRPDQERLAELDRHRDLWNDLPARLRGLAQRLSGQRFWPWSGRARRIAAELETLAGDWEALQSAVDYSTEPSLRRYREQLGKLAHYEAHDRRDPY